MRRKIVETIESLGFVQIGNSLTWVLIEDVLLRETLRLEARDRNAGK